MVNDIETPDSGDDDLVWGAENIGREINRTATQTYYLVATGALKGAVVKLGHRTIVGSRKQLRGLVTLHNSSK
jgi:hypothetical protein